MCIRDSGQAGRLRAVERFSEDAIRPRLLALVDETVSRFRPASRAGSA